MPPVSPWRGGSRTRGVSFLIGNKRYYGRLFIGLFIIMIVVAGCSGGSSGGRSALVGTSWPGITAYNDIVYTAFNDVFAVDPQDPDTVLWTFSNPLRGSGRNFFAAPAVDDDLLVVGDYTDTLFALDPETGEEVWRYQSDKSRFIGGAIMDKNKVYVGSADGILHALDRGDGTVEWEFTAQRDIWSTPVLVDGTLYITSLDRHVYAIDADNGDMLWQFPKNGTELDPMMGAIISSPSYHDGVLYFGSLNNLLYALDTDTQKVLWTYPIQNWIWNAPLVDEESGLLIGGDSDGHVFAIDFESGEEEWTYQASGAVVGTPVLIDENLYFTSGNDQGENNFYIVNPTDGTEIETKSIQGQFTTRFIVIQTGTTLRPVPIYPAPVIMDDMAVIGVHQSDYILYGLDRDSLAVAWSLSPDASSSGTTADGETPQEEQDPLQRITSLLLPFLIAMLLVSLLQRRPQQNN